MPQQAQKSASIFLIIKYIKHLQLSKDTYQIPLPFAMTIISSNMIGHFLVHLSILPSRSSPSALVAEVEKALAFQLRSSYEKLGELFLRRQLIPAMMKIKGRAKNIDNDVDTD